MANKKPSDREDRVLRLLELISSTDVLIRLHKEAGDIPSLKGNVHLKDKLVKELQSLLKDGYNLSMKLDEAA